MGRNHIVAPLAGAWIEIATYVGIEFIDYVAPLAGAWIEISNIAFCAAVSDRRSPRGSVD